VPAYPDCPGKKAVKQILHCGSPHSDHRVRVHRTEEHNQIDTLVYLRRKKEKCGYHRTAGIRNSESGD